MLIVAYIIYRMYKVLKGGLAIYIFLGVLFLFATWWIVSMLKMNLMSMILGQFTSVGVIAIVIIFQPEIRKFLIMIGNNAVKGNWPLFNKIFGKVGTKEASDSPIVAQIHGAMVRMSKDRTGALIVVLSDLNYPGIEDSGVELNANVSKQLILSVFNKDSPLHDGAMLIYQEKILKASCILPVSDNINVPASAGLRHRAGLGVTEISSAKVFIVSEETGRMAYASSGTLEIGVEDDKILKYLRTAFAE